MAYFDHFALSSSKPVGGWIKRQTKHHEFTLLQQWLPGRNCAVLEIGPGKGELTDLFMAAGYHNYTAVEPNDLMREQLERKGIKTKNYLIPQLQEESDRYDALVLIDVFEHLNSASDAQLFMTEARRVLRPGGVLYILSPDYLHWKEDFFNCDFSHNNVTSVRRAQQLFVNYGFQTRFVAYMSGWFVGAWATVMSNIARLALSFANSNGHDQKLYKLKLTMLRRFVIIGTKQP